MQKKELVQVLRSEMPDLTDGPFDVGIESDDGGSHICVTVEIPEDAPKVVKKCYDWKHQRIIVKKVPPGWLEMQRKRPNDD
jgi:hypothetical protein